jgi:hypothetical protein
MRKLGHGQFVIFLAPPEIDKKIRAVAVKQSRELITSSDVLLWAMSETCDRIVHYVGYWVHQGVNYTRRKGMDGDLDVGPGLSGSNLAALRRAWVEPEARSLEEMYAVKTTTANPIPSKSLDMQGLHDRISQLGVYLGSNSLMDEEQERELSQEKEEQRQIERPPPAKPAQHNIHSDLIRLVRTGDLTHSSAFASPLLTVEYLDSQSASWSPRLLATTDFSRTVIGYQDHREYLRPVNWILSVHSYQDTSTPTLIILSPFEVNELMFEIRKSHRVHLHIYTPRTSRSIQSVEDLRFHCIPPLCASWNPPSLPDTVQLNLWAGQLYLQDDQSYRTLCRILGIVSNTTHLPDGAYDNDGFVVHAKDRDGEMANLCRFEHSPIQFLKTLFDLRRKGLDYRLTHLGNVLNGRALTEDDFGQ